MGIRKTLVSTAAVELASPPRAVAKKLHLFCAGVATSLLVAGTAPAWASQDKCEEARAAGIAAAHTRFDGAIGNFDKLVQDIRAKNGNPDDIAIKINGAFMPLSAIKSKMENDRQMLVTGANEQADGCNAGLEPYQKAADLLVATFTGGAEKLLPGKMGSVDVSQILAGYPLGGPDALVPKARDQVLAALGVSGDAEKFIKDPIQTILGGNCSFVRNPFGKGC
jgi:hypothetical protein